MNSLIAVSHFDPEQVSHGHYAAFIATVGYERRARYACQRLTPRATHKVAPAFPERQVCEFDENRRWFSDAGFDIHVVKDDEVERWSQSCLTKVAEDAKDDLRIGVDISSLSRFRLASVVAAIMRLNCTVRITVEFVYSLALWSAPSKEPGPIVSAGAVLPFFAGWSIDPNSPIIAVIGLGYEPDKAVGAYEFLEATRLWAFLPTSGDSQYTRDINRANESLLKRVPESKQITYHVDQPLTCFGTLESVVSGAFEYGRPVLLPFGPKLFALCSLLVSCVHRDVPVWRISSGQYGPALDRVASGEIVGLRAVFEPTEAITKPPRSPGG